MNLMVSIEKLTKMSWQGHFINLGDANNQDDVQADNGISTG
jgi:hypothetical protein